MPRRTATSPTNLQMLAQQFGEERWREVIRLFVAMAPRSLFEAFMGEVIAAGRLAGRHEYTSLCLREALQPSEEAFIKALRDPAQRRDALQALNVLADITPEPMRGIAEAITSTPKRYFGTGKLPDEERDLAARLLPHAPAPHAAPVAGPLVFISYSSCNQAAVTRLRTALERAGIRVWQDASEVKPGDVIARRIEEGVTGCTYFLPILSPHFHASAWTRFEDNLAWQREVEEERVVVVPILLDGDTRALPLRYRQRRFIDLRADPDAGTRELLDFLRQPTTLPTVRINPLDGTELVLIPAGAFKAGSKEEKDNPLREMPLPAFYLARTPVTNAQYRTYMDANPDVPRPEFYGNERYAQPEQPVVGVSVAEAEAYCRWAGLRLPTEWEWEKGARGTDGRTYPWGNQRPTKDRANYNMRVGQPTAVGTYPKGASPYGLLDMAGNVWEWTASTYKEGEDWKTVRGGSFGSHPVDLRAAVRSHFRPDDRFDLVGFRCAQDP